MTNFERIKNMSVEEMAKLIDRIGNVPCECCSDKTCTGDSTKPQRCRDSIKKYLEEEVKDNG